MSHFVIMEWAVCQIASTHVIWVGTRKRRAMLLVHRLFFFFFNSSLYLYYSAYQPMPSIRFNCCSKNGKMCANKSRTYSVCFSFISFLFSRIYCIMMAIVCSRTRNFGILLIWLVFLCVCVLFSHMTSLLLRRQVFGYLITC